MTPFFNINHLMLIIFLDNSLILSDKVWSFPSILTSKYILRVIGKPTDAIRFCKSNSKKILLSKKLCQPFYIIVNELNNKGMKIIK